MRTVGAAPTLLIAEQSDWRYRKGTSEPSTPMSAWRQPGFVEDGSWLTGQASIGYGEGHIRTTLSDMRNNYSTVYFRKTFNVTDPAAVSSLLLQAQFDDAINVWINGAHLRSYGVAASELPYTATGANIQGTISQRGVGVKFRSRSMCSPRVSPDNPNSWRFQ